jgi:two-component system chemotaxis sensor kinase CheA
MEQMAEIRETFFQECDEQLAELEAGLTKMADGTASADTVNAVFRSVHSIKGGAGIFNLEALVRFAHVFETTLDDIRGDRLSATPVVMTVFLRAADLLADLVKASRHGNELNAEQTNILIATLRNLSNQPPAPATSIPMSIPADYLATTSHLWIIKFRPHNGLYEKANEAAFLLRELGRLGEMRVTIDTAQLPPLEELDPDGAYLGWTIELTTDSDATALHAVFEFVEGDCDLTIEAVSSAEPEKSAEEMSSDMFSGFEFFTAIATADSVPANQETTAKPPAAKPVENTTEFNAAAATIRVDLERVDRMIDLVGELVINEAMLSQRVLEAGINRASGVAVALEELEHLTREIQDSVMAIRAQPVRSVFQRMPRLVREVAAQTGKQVRLMTEGESTEVDKTVIERIADPLTHMIRNAIDHGLESVAERIAAGKPVEGVVRLAALHRSGRIVVEVADDGAGIDRTRVKSKAIEKGLIAADAPLSDEEIDNLIFLPGFSTASTVTDISGRGVGMDVVKRSVQALGGRISISSRPGEGSTFTLSLPLTLAVLDGMVVTTADHTLIVPLAAILETLQPKAQDVHPLDHAIQVLSLRGGYVPMIDVAMALGYRNTPLEPTKSVALLVECEGGSQAVLLFDGINGQRQVVIKSLEANYRAVEGIAAATVMGDGRVALILDVDVIVSSTRADGPRFEINSQNSILEAV